MKKLIILFSIMFIVFIVPALVGAQVSPLNPTKPVTIAAESTNDDSGGFKIKPSVSVGYLWNFESNDYALRAENAGIGGVIRRKYGYKGSPALYLAGKIPFCFGERFEATIGGSYAIPTGASDLRADDFNGVNLGGRTWDTKTYWATADFNLAYALVKNFCCLKALTPILGIRYDHSRTNYSNPHDVSPGFAVASPTDNAKFYSSTLLPYYGLSATLCGLKIGKFGGDLKLSAINGWRAWGEVEHKETRDAVGTRHDKFKGDLASGTYFVEAAAEYPIISFGFPEQCIGGALSLFAKYNLFSAEGELDGKRRVAGGVVTETDNFDFEMHRSAIVGGLSLEITF